MENSFLGNGTWKYILFGQMVAIGPNLIRIGGSQVVCSAGEYGDKPSDNVVLFIAKERYW